MSRDRPSSSVAAGEVVFGGSFDPPHFGHFICARAAAEAVGAAQVRLIVANASPFKPPDATPAGLRVEMVRAAVADDPGFVVDDRETLRDGLSYTADTVDALFDETGQPVRWLIGSDLLPTLHRWHRSADLLRGTRAQFLVMRRAGTFVDWDSLPPAVARLRESTIDVPAIDLSSSLVRQRVADGKSVRYLVPAAVEALIVRHGLYRGVRPAPAVP